MLSPQKRLKRHHEAVTILDLPAELVVYICRCDQLKLNDIYNLAISNSQLYNYLFRELNSCLWKSKFIKKYGPLDKDEYEVIIDEQNTWKSEIMMSINLDRIVPSEIMKMPCKYMKFKHVPYHAFPLSEQLHSTYQSHRYYVLSAVATYYKHLRSRKRCKENYDKLYMAHQFLIYTSHVYFGYKLIDFLSLPPNEQIVERGFYLLGRWISSIDNTPYQKICKKIDDIAINVFNHIRMKQPQHPLFEHENCLDQVIQRGKTNLDHDLFDENSTLFIFDCIKQIFSENHKVCLCINDPNCFLLKKVIERNKGCALLHCVIYESVARRLGVKVKLTATVSFHSFITWISSSPGKLPENPIPYLLIVPAKDAMLKQTICPVSQKLADHLKGDSTIDLLWAFSTEMLWTTQTEKNLLDLQKLQRPNDTKIELKRKHFLKRNGYCSCPLLRNSLNPIAPNHDNEKNIMFRGCDNIFPLVPKMRGKDQNPIYSVGMMIEIVAMTNSASLGTVTLRGVIVGWTVTPRNNPKPNIEVYHLLIEYNYDGEVYYQDPVIRSVCEKRSQKLRRCLEPFDNTKNIGKFFKNYSHELRAYVPIDDLAKLYPDDHSYTIGNSVKIGK